MQEGFWADYERAFRRWCWAPVGDEESRDRLLEYLWNHLCVRPKIFSSVPEEDYADCAIGAFGKLANLLISEEEPSKKRFLDETGEPCFKSMWLPFVSTARNRTVFDWLRRRTREQGAIDDIIRELNESNGDDDDSDFQFLYRLIGIHADRCWLGEPGPDHDRQLLFAQFVVIHGLSREEAWALAFGPRGTDSKYSDKQADRILKDKTILQYLAYYELRSTRLQLLQHILDTDIETPQDLVALLQQANCSDCPTPNDRWTWAEIRVIHLYHWGRKNAQFIATSISPELSIDQVQKIIVRSQGFYPFTSLMGTLLERLDKAGVSTDFLRKKPVMARLTWDLHSQGHKLDDLALMLTDAAKLCGCTLTRNSFHGWIFNQRLKKKLLECMAGQGIDVVWEEPDKTEGEGGSDEAIEN